MNKSERKTKILQLARDMAASGDYDGYLDIENAITQKGFLAAGTVIQAAGIRQSLNTTCKAVREKKQAQ